MNESGDGLSAGFGLIGFSPRRNCWGSCGTSRHWWLTPIIVVLLLMTALVVFLESSAIAPFIYALC